MSSIYSYGMRMVDDVYKSTIRMYGNNNIYKPETVTDMVAQYNNWTALFIERGKVNRDEQKKRIFFYYLWKLIYSVTSNDSDTLINIYKAYRSECKNRGYDYREIWEQGLQYLNSSFPVLTPKAFSILSAHTTLANKRYEDRYTMLAHYTNDGTVGVIADRKTGITAINLMLSGFGPKTFSH